MSVKRPGAGVRVSGGRLRVDAARAIDKLRSYQLADPTTWVLEVVRAGVGLAATAISVEGNASDVFVAIACEPPPDASLPRLFEELVDPSTDAAARPLRLLAIGLNAALGGATHFADVYVIDPAGERRVRFTPDVFETVQKDGVDLAPKLRALRVEVAAIPRFAPRPARGVLVHVRAKVALAVLSRWATGDLPRELLAVNVAATELGIPISVNGLPVPRDPAILLREPLDEGGYVALLTPHGAMLEATLEAAELGVVLSREPWSLGLGGGDSPVPLVLRVDRPRLPTNAARSAVRWDEPALERALADGRDALRRLLVRLVNELDEERDHARRSWLRLAALSLLAADVRGASYRARLVGGQVHELLDPLLDAAVLLDAMGRPRSVRSLGGASEIAEVHLDSVYVDGALAPWLSEVLAAPPGDPTHLLFGDFPPPSAEALVRAASTAAEIRERWLSQPVLTPVVAEASEAIVRVPLGSSPGAVTQSAALAVRDARGREKRASQPPPARSSALERLQGEVALGAGEDGCVVELRLEGRTLERVRFASSVPIRVVADHPGLSPTASFDAAVDDGERRAVMLAVEAAILAGCESVGRRLAGQDPLPEERASWPDGSENSPDPERLRAVAREGLVRLAGDASRGSTAMRVASSPLERAPCWVSADGTARTLAALREEKVLGLVARERAADAVLPTKRVVLVVSNAERLALTQLLPRPRWIDYGHPGAARYSAADLARRHLATCPVGIVFDDGECRGFAGWGVDRTELDLSHVGVPLGQRDAPEAAVPTRVRADDDRIVPTGDWQLFESGRKGIADVYAPALLSREIARQVTSAWLGRAPTTLHRSVPLSSEAVVRSVLREAKHGLVERADGEALRAFRILPVHGREEPASWEEVAVHGGAIPFVPPGQLPAEPTRGPLPFALSLDRVEAEGVARLLHLDADVVDTTSLVRAALRKEVREERLGRLRRAAPVPVAIPGAQPVTKVAGTGILEGLVGYAPHVREGFVRVAFEGRPFLVLSADVGLPPSLEGAVSVDESLIEDRGDALTEVGVSRVRGAALAGARELLPQIAASRGAAFFHDASVVSLAVGLVHRKRSGGAPSELNRALRALKTLVSAAGTPLSIEEALAGRVLHITTEAVEWVGPLPGEDPDPLDVAIAHFPFGPETPSRRLLERLADGTIEDVTVALRRLIGARRAARGLSPRPPLPSQHEPGLARTIEALARRSSQRELILGTLGFGAIVLWPTRPSRIAFYAEGTRILEEEIDFVPSFEAAIESPLLGARADRMDEEVRARVRRGIQAALAELLRVLADDKAFLGAPAWAIDAQRDAALLGGKEHLDQLSEVPLFETTSGTRASPAAVLAQAARFGDVWWTRELESALLPLDPERLVLRLSVGSAASLGTYARLFDAKAELARDQVARANRDRPPVDDLAPTAKERAGELSAVGYTSDSREYAIVPLLPHAFSAARLELYRGRKLLEERTEVPGPIPAIVRVDSRELVPNRMWDGVVRDEEVESIERVVAQAIERAVIEKLPLAPASATELLIDAGFMGAVPHSRGRVVRGRLWLGGLDPRANGGVRVVDATDRSIDHAEPAPLVSTAPQRSPAVIPLEGVLLLWGPARAAGASTLDAVGRHAYQRLLAQVSKRLAAAGSPDPDLDLAHLIVGASLGFLGKGTAKDLPSIGLPFHISGLATVAQLVEVVDDGISVIAVDPADVEGVRRRKATLGRPAFARDGSLAAMRLELALGDKALSLADVLAEQLAEEVSEEVSEVASELPPEVADAPREEKAIVAKPRRKKGESKNKRKAPAPIDEPQAARAGPIEPLAVSLGETLGRLSLAGRVGIAPEARSPMIRVADGEISLAGADPILRAIAGTSVGRTRASRLLAAFVASANGDRTAILRQLHELLR